MLKTAFWISFLFITYTYAGYPFILFLLARFFQMKVHRATPDDPPSVSIIIAAKNEETNIRKRLENLLAQDYPSGKMEIIVISDGSSDSTGTIVNEYVGTWPPGDPENSTILLITHTENRGKPAALNAGLEIATGDVIVFTDARQEFESNAISELIANFGDPGVGAVSGELMFRKDGDTAIRAEMGLYWNYEKWIRKTESRIHSVAGATGGIYAARRSLVEALPEPVILDDVMVPMRAVLKGYRTVFESRAIAWDTVSKDLAQEKKRKVRTLLGNYQLIQLMPELLTPGKNPIFFQFVSHKFMRLLVPFFLIMMSLSAAMTGEGPYIIFFLATVAFAVFPLFEKRLSSVPLAGKIASVSRAFFSLNYFALLAFLRFIRPGKEDIW
ncbi:MAG: glycosyltransferase family 2 protein [Candidatus Krumholzibacteria bacterium]|nr:glycosyltransferase family 2 protein [Candidatus Krumholzibacteria bacterium]